VQKGLVEAGGTVDPYTFLGCDDRVDGVRLPERRHRAGEVRLDAGDLTTATAYAAPSYPASPSSTTSATGRSAPARSPHRPRPRSLGMATPIADFRDASVSINNNLRTDRFNGGGAGRKSKPLPGLRDISGSATVEYDSTTFRDAVLNETPMGLLFQYTGGALSTGVETIQLVLPEVKFDAELAKTNGTDLITQAMKFAVLDNLTAAQPIWLVVRTSESAL
jgi:hypothetical protein